MKNRAKCKLCNEVLESFHRYDHVSCKCGEISISGGRDTLECSAKNWSNFLRVDDQGNEIVIKVQDSKGKEEQKAEDLPALTKDDKIKMLEEMVKNIENLPQHAMAAPINHYDLFNYMAMILSILKHKRK